jgi:hypothetical protein
MAFYDVYASDDGVNTNTGRSDTQFIAHRGKINEVLSACPIGDTPRLFIKKYETGAAQFYGSAIGNFTNNNMAGNATVTVPDGVQILAYDENRACGARPPPSSAPASRPSACVCGASVKA